MKRVLLSWASAEAVWGEGREPVLARSGRAWKWCRLEPDTLAQWTRGLTTGSALRSDGLPARVPSKQVARVARHVGADVGWIEIKVVVAEESCELVVGEEWIPGCGGSGALVVHHTWLTLGIEGRIGTREKIVPTRDVSTLSAAATLLALR